VGGFGGFTCPVLEMLPRRSEKRAEPTENMRDQALELLDRGGVSKRLEPSTEQDYP